MPERTQPLTPNESNAIVQASMTLVDGIAEALTYIKDNMPRDKHRMELHRILVLANERAIAIMQKVAK